MWVAEEDERVIDQNREIDPTPLASVLGEATRRGGDSREADIRLPDNHGWVPEPGASKISRVVTRTVTRSRSGRKIFDLSY